MFWLFGTVHYFLAIIFFPFSGKGFQQREDLKNQMKKSKTKKQQQTNYDLQILPLKAKRP